MDFNTSDLCDQYDSKVAVLSPDFNAYGGIQKCSGIIATCRLIDNNTELIRLLKTAGENRICVVDVAGKYVAVVGDKLMGLAAKNGWSGIVVNGYVRDIQNTQNIPVGLWALGVCPKKAIEPNSGTWGERLSFAGVELDEGDFIYIDSDGIIVSKEALCL